jgi:hypothetical protein
MRIQIIIDDVTPEQLPHTIDAMFDATITTPTQGRYRVTTKWHEDNGGWTSQMLSALHSYTTTETPAETTA